MSQCVQTFDWYCICITCWRNNHHVFTILYRFCIYVRRTSYQDHCIIIQPCSLWGLQSWAVRREQEERPCAPWSRSLSAAEHPAGFKGERSLRSKVLISLQTDTLLHSPSARKGAFLLCTHFFLPHDSRYREWPAAKHRSVSNIHP